MKSRIALLRIPVLVLLWGFVGTGTGFGAQEAELTPTLPLAEAVDKGLRTHPSLLAAGANEDASMAAVGRVKAEYYPFVSTQANLTQFQKPMIVAPFHSFDFTRVPQFEKTLIQGDVAVAYKLFDGGARRSRVAGAEAQASVASAAETGTRLVLIARIARSYLEVLTARGVLDAQDQRAESLTAERRRVDLLLTEGRAARVELLRVDAALAQAEAERVAAAARLQLGERELARLIEVAPEEARVDRLRAVELSREALSEQWADWLEAARSSSSDLEQARRRVEAAEAARRVAGAQWIPEVDAFAAYQGYGSTHGGGSLEWHAGLGVNYPVFTGGARSKAIAEADARLEQAREQLRVVELEIERGVDRALTVAVETRALVTAVADGVRHQTEVVRIERLSLEAGAGTQTDYLRAEADLARARSALVEARNGEIGAWVELARESGVLSPEWLDRHLEGVR